MRSTWGFLLGAAAIALVAGVAGGLIALWVDSPDTVRVYVPIEPMVTGTPPVGLSEADEERLTLRYVELGGGDDRLTARLVQEIGLTLCNSDMTVAELAVQFERDLSLTGGELATFASEVRSACPDA